MYLIWRMGCIVDHKRGRQSAAKEQPHREVGTQSHGPRLREVAGLPSPSRRVRALLGRLPRRRALRDASDEDRNDEDRNPASCANAYEFEGLELVLGGGLLGADGHDLVITQHANREQVSARLLDELRVCAKRVATRAVYFEDQSARPGHLHDRLDARAVLEPLRAPARRGMKLRCHLGFHLLGSNPTPVRSVRATARWHILRMPHTNEAGSGQ